LRNQLSKYLNMKTRISTIIFLLSLLTASLVAQDKSSMNIYFPTLGNCVLCKIRIEAAVNRLPGIENVYWDNVTESTDVTYDDNVTDAFEIMHAIAAVGHDTEWFPAPDSAYNTLVGTCCEYQRTIDYTNVQIGYLVLMGIWVYPLTDVAAIESSQFDVYPTVSHGIFNISLDNNFTNSKPEVSLFSMHGSKVYSSSINPLSQSNIDVSFLGRGHYVVVLSTEKRIIAQRQVIIN